MVVLPAVVGPEIPTTKHFLFMISYIIVVRGSILGGHDQIQHEHKFG